MPRELQTAYLTNRVVYALSFNATGGVYNSSTLIPELPSNDNWSTYVLLVPEVSGTGIYEQDFLLLPAGVYNIVLYEQGGSGAVSSDTVIGAGEISWQGASVSSAELTAQEVWNYVTRTLTSSASSITSIDIQNAMTEQGYTIARAGKLDYLDAYISSAGSTGAIAKAVWEYVDRTLTQTASAMGISAADVWAYATRTLSAFGFNVPLDLTQVLGSSQTPGTVGRALQLARSQARGNWVIDTGDNTLTLYDTDGTTIAVFSLAPAGGPYLSRTVANDV